MCTTLYCKHYISLKFNLNLFTHLIHQLGVFSSLSFHDVLTLNKSVMLPHSVLALILVFSTSDVYEAQKVNHESEKKNYIKSEEKDMI